jgi:hypothetical protein
MTDNMKWTLALCGGALIGLLLIIINPMGL